MAMLNNQRVTQLQIVDNPVNYLDTSWKFMIYLQDGAPVLNR